MHTINSIIDYSKHPIDDAKYIKDSGENNIKEFKKFKLVFINIL